MEKFDLTPIEDLMSNSINKLNNIKTDNETILRNEILSILKSVETDAKKGCDGDYTPIVCVDSHDYYIVINNLCSLIQSITDPENQPNQYGVMLEYARGFDAGCTYILRKYNINGHRAEVL